MINEVYELLKTIMNKELRGNITPQELNLIAKQVQEEIFRGYFEDEARDKYKEKVGRSGKGYSNLSLNQRQRLDMFSKVTTLTYSNPNFILPPDLYMIKEFGITAGGSVVEEMEGQNIGFLSKSLSAPSSIFPIYEQQAGEILITPTTITEGVICRYLRKPLDPKWTYTVVNNTELYNPSASDFQDFELHPSEFSNIVISMLSYFGINIRETEVTQYAEAKKHKNQIKEE